MYGLVILLQSWMRVKIESGAIVGANAVVNDVPKNCMAEIINVMKRIRYGNAFVSKRNIS